MNVGPWRNGDENEESSVEKYMTTRWGESGIQNCTGGISGHVFCRVVAIVVSRKSSSIGINGRRFPFRRGSRRFVEVVQKKKNQDKDRARGDSKESRKRQEAKQEENKKRSLGRVGSRRGQTLSSILSSSSSSS